VDEAGTTGNRLSDKEQPVFVMAGLQIRDEGWRQTEGAVLGRLKREFGGTLPTGFELHAHELLSPAGSGVFTGWPWDRRHALALDLLTLIQERKHQIFLQAVYKATMAKATPPPSDYGFDWHDPWEVSLDGMLTQFEEYLRRMGTSARGLVVIDHDQSYLGTVRRLSRLRHGAKGWRRLGRVIEIGYSAISHENAVIQLADVVAFTTKKHLTDGLPANAQALPELLQDRLGADPAEDPEVYEAHGQGCRILRLPASGTETSLVAELDSV
jgi:hypothetical protein